MTCRYCTTLINHLLEVNHTYSKLDETNIFHIIITKPLVQIVRNFKKFNRLSTNLQSMINQISTKMCLLALSEYFY